MQVVTNVYRCLSPENTIMQINKTAIRLYTTEYLFPSYLISLTETIGRNCTHDVKYKENCEQMSTNLPLTTVNANISITIKAFY